jgi:ATP-dependent Clp protease ATP-binding subunit ClpA
LVGKVPNRRCWTPRIVKKRGTMLIYDDTAAPAIQAASEEARRLGADAYDTQHVLLALLRTGDPVTRRVTEETPHLAVDTVRAALTAGRPASIATAAGSPRDRPPTPAREFRQAIRDFTAKWGPLIKARKLPRRPKFSTAELWLILLEPSTRSSRLLQSLHADPHKLRAVVLNTMVADSQLVPDWPNDVPKGKAQRFLTHLVTWVRTGAAPGGDASGACRRSITTTGARPSEIQ